MLLNEMLVISQFHRVHQRHVLATLERRGFHKWNTSHIGIVTMLAEEPKSTAELAHLIGLSKQATSLCIRDLADRQLVRVRSRSTHVRVQLVYLTADGWAFLTHWAEGMTVLDHKYASLVGDEALQRLKDTLVLVTKALDSPQN